VTPAELSQALSAALKRAVAESAVALDPADIPAAVQVERPRQREHGDWSTNVALQLAKKAGLPPRQLAETIAHYVLADDAVAAAEVAGPGFVNLTLDKAAAGALAKEIVQAGESYGRGNGLQGQTINLEFVSANPTGPLHLAGARWAAVGDSMARSFEAQGASVIREYYFNDHGSQINRFARSLMAAAHGRPVPEDGYGGQYIKDLAQVITAQDERIVQLTEPEQLERFRAEGVEMMFEEIKRSLHDFGVDFDVYFHERSLYDQGEVADVIGQLKKRGELYEEDGAWWLRSSAYGDDKDRVVIKSDGEAAYIAGDIAYFKNKRARGADRAIYLLGADHHGYIARLKAAAQALGDDPDRVEVLIGQMVFLVKDHEPVKLSKRSGTVVTLEDLTEAVGVGAARYALVRSSIDSSLEIDLDLWASRSNDNPVYYVQYAHARTRSVDRNAAQAGVRREDGFAPKTLDHESEAVLIGVLAEFPEIAKQAADLREPHRIARYLEVLAAAYHKWYDQRRVIPYADEAVSDVHRTRLWLNDAVGQVLANGLALLGVSAPERM
jgi:arginyl-tRNA synthetase